MKLRNLTLALGLLVSAGAANASIISLGDGPHGGSSAHEGDIQIGDISQCVTVASPAGDPLAGGNGYGTCTAIGRLAYNYYGGTSIGDQARSWRGGVAIGFRSTATVGAVAINGNAQDVSVAILGNASVSGVVAILGTADALNSIAIGGHTRGRENIVTFGDASTGATRQIAGVTAGTEDTDAVNVKQLRDAQFGGTNPYFAADGANDGSDSAEATGPYSTVGGASAKGTAYGNTVMGSQAEATADSASVFGHQGKATHEQSTVLGAYGTADAKCTTIGYASHCEEDNTTSFGRDGDTRRLTNVSDGRDDTDAANMRQLNAVDLRVTQTQSVVASQASYFGGGASYNPSTGINTAPSFALSMGTYTNVYDALLALDARIEESGTGETGPQGPSGPTGQTGADGRSAYEVAVDEGFEGTRTEWLESLQGADGADGEDGVGGGSTVKPGANVEVSDNQDGTQTVGVADNIQLSDQGSVQVGATTVNGSGVRIEGGPSMTTDGIDAASRRVLNVAPGRVDRTSTDAINGSQLWAAEDRWNDRWTNVETRIDGLDKRLSGVCAMAAANSQAVAASTTINKRHRVSGGMGYCGGKAAMAANLSWDATTPSGSPMAFSVGVSSSGDDTSIGAGFSFGW